MAKVEKPPRVLIKKWGGNKVVITRPFLYGFRLGDELTTPTKITKERILAEGNFSGSEAKLMASTESLAMLLHLRLTKGAAKELNLHYGDGWQPVAEVMKAAQTWALDHGLLDEYYPYILARENEFSKLHTFSFWLDLCYKGTIFCGAFAYLGESLQFLIASGSFFLATFALRSAYKHVDRSNRQAAAAFNFLLALHNRDNLSTDKSAKS